MRSLPARLATRWGSIQRPPVSCHCIPSWRLARIASAFAKSSGTLLFILKPYLGPSVPGNPAVLPSDIPLSRHGVRGEAAARASVCPAPQQCGERFVLCCWHVHVSAPDSKARLCPLLPTLGLPLSMRGTAYTLQAKPAPSLNSKLRAGRS